MSGTSCTGTRRFVESVKEAGIRSFQISDGVRRGCFALALALVACGKPEPISVEIRFACAQSGKRVAVEGWLAVQQRVSCTRYGHPDYCEIHLSDRQDHWVKIRVELKNEYYSGAPDEPNTMEPLDDNDLSGEFSKGDVKVHTSTNAQIGIGDRVRVLGTVEAADGVCRIVTDTIEAL